MPHIPSVLLPPAGVALPRGRKLPLLDIVPGAALAVAVAAAALGIHGWADLGGLSPLILALLLGMTLGNVASLPAALAPGTFFAMRRLLRFAIVLLGLQLTLSEVAAIGMGGVAMLAAGLASTFLFTLWLGRRLGVERSLVELIAAGTSICGAAAVVAANTVSRARDEDVAYAVACVTLFGSIAMLAFPLLKTDLGLDAGTFGLWTGAAIHEIAQVVAASYQAGEAAGETATVAKLTRVSMLAPTILMLGAAAAMRARRGCSDEAGPARVPMPWFVFGFVALMVLNSVVDLPPSLREPASVLTTFLLTTALAAMGLSTDIGRLGAKGVRPLLLGAASSLFIAVVTLVLVKAVV